MSRFVQGPFRNWDVDGGVTAAQIQAFLNALPAGGYDVRLADADFTLEAQLALPDDVILVGKGHTRTRFLDGYAPNVNQADVATNSLILRDRTITGTVNTTLASRSKIGATSSTLASGAGLAIGQWLAITSVNLADEALLSDGAGNDTMQIIQVLSVAGAVITHAPLVKHAIAGSTVQSTTPRLNTGIVDLTLDGAGGTIANGFTALGCFGVTVDRVAVRGFSRFGIEIGRGSQRATVRSVHSLGEVNGVVRIEAADQCEVRWSSFDPTGLRQHANGIPRGHIMLANDCHQPTVVDNAVGRGCLAFWDRKSHGLHFRNLRVFDFVPDEAATRLAAANEYDTGARIGIVMSSSGKLANSANPVGSDWEGVYLHGCSSQMTAGVAFGVYLHDLFNCHVKDVYSLNLGGAAAAGTLSSVHVRDCTGLVEVVPTAAGAEPALQISGSRFPIFKRLARQYESGGPGEAGPNSYALRIEADVVDAPLLIEGFSAGGFLNIRGIGAASGIGSGLVMREVRWADNWYSGEGTVFSSVNNCPGGAGSNGVRQGEGVKNDTAARVIAGFNQFTEITTALDDWFIVADGEQHINMAFQTGAIMALSDGGHAIVRAGDEVFPGDFIMPDHATAIGGSDGKYFLKNNAPPAGAKIARAQSYKAAGSAGPVLLGKAFRI